MSCTLQGSLHEVLGVWEGRAYSDNLRADHVQRAHLEGWWPGLKGQPLLLALNSDPELMIFMLMDQDSACGCPCTCATTLSMDICLVFCFVLFTKCFTCIHLSWIEFHSNSVNRRCSYFYCYFYFTKDKAGLWEVETLPNHTTTQSMAAHSRALHCMLCLDTKNMAINKLHFASIASYPKIRCLLRLRDSEYFASWLVCSLMVTGRPVVVVVSWKFSQSNSHCCVNCC